MSDNEKSSFDVFELCMAIILGLGALGGAWAGYQGGLWGGNQATAYTAAGNKMGEASATMTKFGTLYNQQVQVIARDFNVDLQAKQLVVQIVMDMAKTESIMSLDLKAQLQADIQKNAYLAKYLYAVQLSDTARDYLKIPQELRSQKDEAFAKLPDEALEKLVEADLNDEDYLNKQMEDAEALFEESVTTQKDAQLVFKAGQQYNANGDEFSLTGVIYTVALFLAGIGLVFKSKVRWAFGALGVLVFVVATVHLASNKWVPSDLSADEVPADADDDARTKDAIGTASAAASATPN